MAQKAPVILPKGQRYPGSGRVKGTPNHVSVDARTLAAQLVNDPNYQQRLRADFKRRKLHPTIESLMWQFVIGKPVAPIAIQGSLDITSRLDAERDAFAALDIEDLEVLAAESQALVDRAMALARRATGSVNALTPQDVVVEPEPSENPSESLGNSGGSDNGSSVNLSPTSEGNE